MIFTMVVPCLNIVDMAAMLNSDHDELERIHMHEQDLLYMSIVADSEPDIVDMAAMVNSEHDELERIHMHEQDLLYMSIVADSEPDVQETSFKNIASASELDEEDYMDMNTGYHDLSLEIKKKGRGMGKNLAFRKKKETGEAFDIQFSLPFKKVVGKDAKMFKTEVCCTIRKHLPLTVKSWKYIKKNPREIVWILLKIRFNLDDGVRSSVLKQDRSETNRRNGKKVVMLPTLGCKTYCEAALLELEESRRRLGCWERKHERQWDAFMKEEAEHQNYVCALLERLGKDEKDKAAMREIDEATDGMLRLIPPLFSYNDGDV